MFVKPNTTDTNIDFTIDGDEIQTNIYSLPRYKNKRLVSHFMIDAYNGLPPKE